MLLGLLAAVASEVLLDSELPTIALMAVGYLAPNVDRIGGPVRASRRRVTWAPWTSRRRPLSRWAIAARSAGPS